jgi:hypothetical protein
MTDRELLGLAAKAAGYDVVWNERWQAFQHRAPQPDAHGQFRHPWVPLTDDGDALRLAVKLGMDVSVEYTLPPFAKAMVNAATDILAEPIENCPYSATRRAIVRAAAEIGRAEINAPE